MYSLADSLTATKTMRDDPAATKTTRDLKGGEILTASLKQASDLVAAGGSGLSSIKDVNYNTISTATTNNYFHVTGQVQLTNHPHGPQPITYTSLTPGTATIDQTGHVTYVAAGLVQIQVTTPTQKYIATWTNYQQGSTTYLSQAGWAPNTVGGNTDAALQALIAGKTAPVFAAPVTDATYGGTIVTASNTYCDIFANLDPANPNAVTKNMTGLWAGVDTSCIAVRWYPHGPNAVLFTPQHVLYAGHYDFPDNLTMSWLGNDGVVYTRTRVGRLGVSVLFNGQYGGEDCEIGVLDSPLPATVVPVKFAPTNWIKYVPSGSSTAAQYPFLCHVQEHRLTIHTMQQNDQNGTIRADGSAVAWSASPATTGPYVGWAQTIRGGDSGSGNFLLVNNQLCYVGHTMTTGPSGYAEAGFGVEVDAALAASGTAYRRSVADWSMFTSY